MINKTEYKQKIYGLLLNKVPTAKMIETDDPDGFALQDFVVDNLKEEIEWATGIGIIEAVQHIFTDSIANGNI